jgi:hypothetical protein
MAYYTALSSAKVEVSSGIADRLSGARKCLPCRLLLDQQSCFAPGFRASLKLETSSNVD